MFVLYSAYLGEGSGVDEVLGGDLETDVAAALGVPDSLGTGLDLRVDAVVVGGGKDAHVVGCRDGGAVDGVLVTNGGRVAGDGGLLDIVASLATNNKTLVANDGVDIGGGALEQIKEGAEVECGLLEVGVELCAVGAGVGLEGGQDLGLEALGDVLVELELGVEGVEGGPGQGAGNACVAV